MIWMGMMQMRRQLVGALESEPTMMLMRWEQPCLILDTFLTTDMLQYPCVTQNKRPLTALFITKLKMLRRTSLLSTVNHPVAVSDTCLRDTLASTAFSSSSERLCIPSWTMRRLQKKKRQKL